MNLKRKRSLNLILVKEILWNIMSQTITKYMISMDIGVCLRIVI
ncbi:MAG: hypothetical protein ACRDD7_04355 [Peptostreptococcaceae bacterium]